MVNLETDILGKYVEKLMGYGKESTTQESNVTMDLLAKCGF